MSTRLETARLVIRTFEARDAGPWLAMVTDPEVTRFLPPAPRSDRTTELAQRVIGERQAMERELGHAMWAVEEKTTGRFVGQCGLRPVDDQTAGETNIDKWAMADFGGFADNTYPTTFGIFNCTGSSNFGGYCSSQADKLIDASVFSTNPKAVTSEASYLTTQQPGLFGPTPADALEIGTVLVWKKTLSGPPASFATVTQFNINPEMWYFTT